MIVCISVYIWYRFIIFIYYFSLSFAHSLTHSLFCWYSNMFNTVFNQFRFSSCISKSVVQWASRILATWCGIWCVLILWNSCYWQMFKYIIGVVVSVHEIILKPYLPQLINMSSKIKQKLLKRLTLFNLVSNLTTRVCLVTI